MERMLRFVEEERASTMAAVESVTDDRGFYTLDDTAEGALYRVTAWKEGWQIDIVDDVPLDGEHIKAGEAVRFLAERVVVVPFDVRLAVACSIGVRVLGARTLKSEAFAPLVRGPC